tara:strand:- start:49 stop:213 length:165 start_codon:yes stop_codon:yes gene_type:complete
MSNPYKPFWSAQLNKELLMKRSTLELEKIGKKFKIDLDRRVKKSTLVDQLYKVL